METADSHGRVLAIRSFNRFYTRHVGALKQGLLESPWSLTEARILYELAHRQATTARDLARDLGLDPAYLSRIVKRFRARGMVESQPGPADRREKILRLSAEGRRLQEPLEEASNAEVREILAPMDEAAQQELLSAMETIENLLSPAGRADQALVIRPHRVGDVGWIIRRQAMLYHEEYGWDASFEGLVARIAGDFLSDHDPAMESCWVAERDGAILGSVFLVRTDEGDAQLRMLYVEPAARGLGVGKKLVAECMAFARAKGYRRMILWTNSNLHAARAIYEKAGFTLAREEPHHSFGVDLVGQYWETDL